MKETGASVNYVDVVTLPMIRQDYSLVMAKLILASKYPEFSLSLSMPDPEDALALYVQAEEYSAAIALGKLFGLDLRKVFSSLAERCARESQR